LEDPEVLRILEEETHENHPSSSLVSAGRVCTGKQNVQHLVFDTGPELTLILEVGGLLSRMGVQGTQEVVVFTRFTSQ
jgi:hypothetical protein